MLKRIIILLILLVAFVALTVLLFVQKANFFAIFFLALSCLVFVLLIIEHNRNLKNLVFMLNSFESNDFTFHFDDIKSGNRNQKQYNFMLNKLKHIMELEKENIRVKERFYETMLESADTGVIAVDSNGFVNYRNSKVLQLLGLPVLTHLKQLSRLDESVMLAFFDVDEGDEKKVEFYNERGRVMLSLRCTNAVVQGKQFRIIALNSIVDKIEENEMDAYTRLIRVMTHEIMNSISPIASLSETLSKYYGKQGGEVKEGLEVINKTSKGLMAFVESYRSMTRISKPNKKAVLLSEMLTNILTLVKDNLSQSGLTCKTLLSDDSLMLYVDENQISQVMINLIKNAIQAGAKNIIIRASIDAKESITVLFTNDGLPILDKDKNQIFVPFYTTKPNGSGIGLSLSRQIMLMHDGSLQLLSSNEKETVFALVFR